MQTHRRTPNKSDNTLSGANDVELFTISREIFVSHAPQRRCTVCSWMHTLNTLPHSDNRVSLHIWQSKNKMPTNAHGNDGKVTASGVWRSVPSRHIFVVVFRIRISYELKGSRLNENESCNTEDWMDGWMSRLVGTSLLVLIHSEVSCRYCWDEKDSRPPPLNWHIFPWQEQFSLHFASLLFTPVILIWLRLFWSLNSGQSADAHTPTHSYQNKGFVDSSFILFIDCLMSAVGCGRQ